MPRRKQHCPKRMELGEDGEGGGSLAVKGNAEVNEDDADEQDPQLEARTSEPVTSGGPSTNSSSNNSTGSSPAHHVPSPPALKRSVKREVSPTKVHEEDDDAEEDDEPRPLRMSMDEEVEEEIATTTASPLDFSVKSLQPVACLRKRKGVSSTVDVPDSKDKKIKSCSSGSESFPLDLSVKRGSVSPTFSSSSSSPSSAKPHHHQHHVHQHFQHNNHHQHQHHHHSAHSSRQQQSLNPVAKFSSRSESRNPSSSSSSSSTTANSLFSSNSSPILNSRMTVNGSEKKKTFPSAASTSRSVSSHGRQNPWQTQWISRSSEQTRDVFTCVWCKESFRSLQEMTLHMKESPRCGMAGMQHAAAASLSSSQQQQQQQNASSSSASSSPSASLPLLNGSKSSSRQSAVAAAAAAAASASSLKEPMSNAVLAKNNVTLPRKLVRGQDVWLGRGAEQTRQILKCMWCAQSFKTLDEMTRHMRVTQHYTNIISQEQIISWRTPEDKLTQAQVNAVLTCKVCDEAFGSLKELSYHMVKNAHYKEHILRSITEGGHGRRRQTRERRKKSLPVRKLLELERSAPLPSHSPNIQTNIPKVESPLSSIRSDSTSPKALSPQSIPESEKSKTQSEHPEEEREEREEKEEEERRHVKEEREEKAANGKTVSKPNPESDVNSSSLSLFALEKLVENSFDPASKIVTSQGPQKSPASRDHLYPEVKIKKTRSRSSSESNSTSDSCSRTDLKWSANEKPKIEPKETVASPLKRFSISPVTPSPEPQNSKSSKLDILEGEKEHREEIEQLKRAANSSPLDSDAKSTVTSSSASLFALEKLIETSFDSKKKNPPTGFLQRLGIDEEVCPPWHPGLVFRPFSIRVDETSDSD